MIFNVENTRKKKVKVYDAGGVEIDYCYSYNTKTREAKLYLTGNRPNKTGRSVLKKTLKPTKKFAMRWALLKATVKIPGSYIVVNGKRY